MKAAQNSQGTKTIQYGSNKECETENIWPAWGRIMKNPGCHLLDIWDQS